MALSVANINAIYQSILFRLPTSAELATAQAVDNTLGDTAAINEIITSQPVQSNVWPVIDVIQFVTGLAPNATQLSNWVQYLEGGGTLSSVAAAFAASTTFANHFAGGTTINPNVPLDTLSLALGEEIMRNIITTALGPAGNTQVSHLDSWIATGLTTAQILAEFALGTQWQTTIQPATNAYLTDVADVAIGQPGAVFPSGSIFPLAQTTQTVTLTVGTDIVITGGTFGGQTVQADGVLVDAPLAGPNGNNPTLTDGDWIALAGPATGTNNNELLANFKGNATVTNVNITGIPTWIIDQGAKGTINISGDVLVPGAPVFADPIISGLTNLTFSDSSTPGSLNIGNNGEPVYLAPGATSPITFAITVISAVGDASYKYENGVDVDITASAFTVPGSTISVDAESVGGFFENNGSYSLPCPGPILGTYGDPDNYNPNWYGYYQDSYSISAGASAGGPTGHPGNPETGAIGFTNWDVNSSAAESIGGLNIIALGGEGSVSATSLTLTDDGSNTLLYASFLSDSLGGHDWQNLDFINLEGTSGFVTLTGLEASTAAGFDIGLLADVTGPITILGGTGNSFYDLTSLGFTAAAHSLIEGGSNTQFDTTVSELPGWSEVAFNNSVWTENGASEGGSTVIDITNISVGDDASAYQGGSINMANFPLVPLSQPYALIAEPNPSAGTVPFGLPYTYDSTASSLPADPTLGDYLQEGVVPAGFVVLQLLNPDGSTAVELNQNLDILAGPTNFAINMQDVSDNDTYNVSVTGVESAQNLVLFVSDGCSPDGLSRKGDLLDTSSVVTGGGEGSEVFSIPYLTITNYQNVDIVLPSEYGEAPQLELLGNQVTPVVGDDVGLGTSAFIVVPSDTELNTTVNFYDNTADTGGSPPGSEDNLYLGYTQTYNAESGSPYLGSYAAEANLIGKASVVVEVNLDFATPPTSTINDWGTGRFEIGATDVTNLNDQGNGGLIMDLPATYWGALGATIGGSDENLFFETFGNENGVSNLGITVNGASSSTNLLQGSSGPIHLDYAANSIAAALGNDAYYGAVGNDIITGGTGGDNIFGEGGNDTIYLNGHAKGGDGATVWMGVYDVGYSGPQETGTDPGGLLEQAITDFTGGALGTTEQFVNGYGTDVTTIHGFTFQGPGNDVIKFAISDWVTSAGIGIGGPGPTGLDAWDGTHETATTTPVFDTLGSAHQTVVAGTDIVLDNIGGTFANEGALQTSLLNLAGGDIVLSGGGVKHGTSADLLIAYATATSINIADVTLTNNEGAGSLHDTSDFKGANGSLTVTDLVHITTTGGLNSLLPADIHFIV
jgi:hypothetical protein